MSYLDDAYAFARAVLGTNTDEMPDATLALFAADVEESLVYAYPCIGNGGSTNTLSGADLTKFSRALGYGLAALLSRMPAGTGLISAAVETKVAHVTRKSKSADPAAFSNGLDGLSRGVMLRISCVRAAFAGNAPTFSTFALAGARRAAGDPQYVQDMARGKGEREVIHTVGTQAIVITDPVETQP